MGVGSAPSTYTPDPHAVPTDEAFFYYVGLPSYPILVYRTGTKWFSPIGPEAYHRRKELCPVFNHRIVDLWNDTLGLEVDNIMRSHKIPITTIDVVRFRMLDGVQPPYFEDGDLEDESFEGVNVQIAEDELNKLVIGPVTIWVGVFPETTTATAARTAAQEVLALLKRYEITDVDVDFRESIYRHKVGPPLLKHVHDWNPLVNVIGPLTPALGIPIATVAHPATQGTMALYLAEGGDSCRMLGLSCRHVLLGSDVPNLDYVYRPGAHRRNVFLLGRNAYTKFLHSIKLDIKSHASYVEEWSGRIKGLEEREKGTNAEDAERAKKNRSHIQYRLRWAEKAMDKLAVFHHQVEKDWSKFDHRILGNVVYSPAISLDVGEHHFTEDWGVFDIDRAKLGDGFQGNIIDLGTEFGRMLSVHQFTVKSDTGEVTNWRFKYHENRLLPLRGILTDKLMRTPVMKDEDGERCLLVVKNGNATGATLGRANGAFSIVRHYSGDMSVSSTTREWAIINYKNKSTFSKPGDSGSIIADIQGRIGGMLTGGAGNAKSTDITYATPFWWILEQIRAKGFPNVHLDVMDLP